MNRHKRHTIRWMRTAMLLLFASAFVSRCASIRTPTGGPKDTLPPVILSMNPDNFTTNFDARRIYIDFDEFVQVKDQQKEFFTSPQMKKKPTITLRGRGIMVQIRDTLLENQTYALDFGSAIRDNNEGNPLHGMRYVFSTGATVDSMACTGYTTDAYKSDSVSKTFIYFYYADSLPDTPDYDSTIFNRKPDAIARAQGNGIFIAQNLKPVPYRVIAMKDTNDNQMYEPGTDMVGFIDTLCNPASMPDFYIWHDSIRGYVTATPQLYFRMFTDQAFRRQNLSQSERPLRNKAMLYFSGRKPEILSIKFDSIPDDGFIIDPRTEGGDTVAIWFRGTELPDTIRGRIAYMKHDSIGNLVADTASLRLTWRYVESKEEQREREKNEREKAKTEAAGEEWVEPPKPNPFGMRFSQSGGDLNPLRPLEVTFDYPLASIDSTAIDLRRITGREEATPVPIKFRRDTADMLKWYLDAEWQHSNGYTLSLPAGAFTDVAGQSSDSLTMTFNTYVPDRFGRVNVMLMEGRKDMPYIVQLLNGSGRLLDERRGMSTGQTAEFRFVPPGDARLRIIEDPNGNGRWDSGNLVERRQPERAAVYTTDEQETFAIKANWESEITVNLDQMFAPVTMTSLQQMLDAREAVRLRKQLEEDAKRRQAQERDHDHSSGGFGMGGIGSTLGGVGNMF